MDEVKQEVQSDMDETSKPPDTTEKSPVPKIETASPQSVQDTEMVEVNTSNNEKEAENKSLDSEKNAEEYNIDTAPNSIESEQKEGSKSVNKLKRKRCRPRTRKSKVRKFTYIDHNVEVVKNSMMMSHPEPYEEVEYCLLVSNLPSTWSFVEIKNYIDTECGPIDEIELVKDDKNGVGAIKLTYQAEDECKDAFEKLKDKEINGEKLALEMIVETLEYEYDSDEIPEIPSSKSPWKPDLDEWDIDPAGLYSLKLDYLKSLNITPPLDKWVHVSNFRCDKSELRDVMELAGKVLICSVFQVANRYANVMYSHPLEAVQAVSMINGQQFYGLKLNVAMDRSPTNSILLPKGLGAVGPGLGINGKPLRNVVEHYKRFLADQSSDFDRDRLTNAPKKDSKNQYKNVNFKVRSVEEFCHTSSTSSVKNMVTVAKSISVTTTNKPAQNPVPNATRPLNPRPNGTTVDARPIGPGNQVRPTLPPLSGGGPYATSVPARPFGPRPSVQGPRPSVGPNVGVRPNMGPVVGPRPPIGPNMQMGPNGPPRIRPPGPPPTGPGMNQSWNGPRPMGPAPGLMPTPRHNNIPPHNMNVMQSVQLLLSNLPPSTTFFILCEKMGQCGQVMSIQLTTPGCAVVTYANRMQADRCISTYNGMVIDGYRITVKYA